MNDLESYRGKRVIVTGHTGFKGSWLSLLLLQLGAKVSGVSLPPHTSPNLFSLFSLEKRMNSHFVDIGHFEQLETVIQKEKPEIIFHLAAQSLVKESFLHPVKTWMINTIGTLHLLEVIRKTPSVKVCVCVTTDKVYAPKETAHVETDRLGGNDPYSASKAASELLIASYKSSFLEEKCALSTARAGNVLGGGDWSKDRLIPDFMRALFVEKKPLLLRNPSAIRPWQHVLDPLMGYLHLGVEKKTGAWNFAPLDQGKLTVQEIIEEGIRFFGSGEIEIVPSKLPETKKLTLNGEKALTLGWKPLYNIEETLLLTYSWYQAYYAGEDVCKLTEEQISHRLQCDRHVEPIASLPYPR